MANHGYITFRKNLIKEQVYQDLQEINNKRFLGQLKIDQDTGWSKRGSWFIGYEEDSHPLLKSKTFSGFDIWISSPKKLEHRHAHCWAYYLEIVFANELALKYDGLFSDDGFKETWKPRPDKYLSYKKWIEDAHAILKKDMPEAYEKIYSLELGYCPKIFMDC